MTNQKAQRYIVLPNSYCILSMSVFGGEIKSIRACGWLSSAQPVPVFASSVLSLTPCPLGIISPKIYCFCHCGQTRLCESEGCSMEASFGFDGKRKRKYCSTHRLPGMINVKHKRCTYTGCIRQPSYGMEGEKANYCSTHKVRSKVTLCTTADNIGYSLPNLEFIMYNLVLTLSNHYHLFA